MKTLTCLAAAAGLALTAAPALADDHTGSGDIMLNASQKAMMDAWPADRKQTYMNWPKEAQAYYWTLSEEQKNGWWMLNDTQRVQIVGMNAADRANAWRTIAGQMNTSAANTATAATTASNGVRFVSKSMVQDAPAAHNGEYPVCTASMKDNCMNPWEAGRRGPGVPKPLGYWPGKPASEM